MDFLIHWPPGPVVPTVQCQGLLSDHCLSLFVICKQNLCEGVIMYVNVCEFVITVFIVCVNASEGSDRKYIVVFHIEYIVYCLQSRMWNRLWLLASDTCPNW